MDFLTTVILGAIAGFTIFLGLPVARISKPSRSLQAFLNAVAIGILLFLLWDVLSKASEPIFTGFDHAHNGDGGNFILLLLLFAGGFGFGSLGLVYFERYFVRRGAQRSEAKAARKEQEQQYKIT